MRKTGNSFKESNVEKGMVLPFTPLTMTFNDVHYFVDCPAVCPLLTTTCKRPPPSSSPSVLHTGAFSVALMLLHAPKFQFLPGFGYFTLGVPC